MIREILEFRNHGESDEKLARRINKGERLKRTKTFKKSEGHKIHFIGERREGEEERLRPNLLRYKSRVSDEEITGQKNLKQKRK